MNKILITGRTPQPYGGVTVHVSRLVEALKQRKPECFEFTDFRKKPLKTCFQVLYYKVIHLHSSSPYVQFLLALTCKLLGKKAIITFHGNLGRYGFLKNRLVDFSIRLSSTPVILNTESFQTAAKLNKNAIRITAFIPSSMHNKPDPLLLEKLYHFREKHEFLFCTNAWKLTFDKHGNEIYGITGIVRNLEKTAKAGLIVSDPSGSYKVHIQNTFGKIPGNVFIISEHHDFRNVLALCDAFIRNTTTDGDSLSVHEAIEQHVVVFASDCVTRPAACRLFSDIEVVDFVSELRLSRSSENAGSDHYEDAVEKLLNLYETYL
ncbi:glycosyltransferase family 4 protein [Dyadobacter flavalbus]|uniref:Glycosyltransferase family 4 protein n=1 Tax=Dyadobacter flavalbus TaxID=2579942 RepID=A0A5M8R030_9BACT|nr:glycosyltransferase family 4 protein [Dyadobacter flavalbus]KAA6440971.1 glycosyltransferase family 4 protein [Dyadobacter flavalbus]